MTSQQQPVRIRLIGLGNTLLTDDGAGILAVREIRRRLEESERHIPIDTVETEVAGFALLELLAGWKRVILVDSLQFDRVAPGTVLRLEPKDLRTSLRLRSVHDIDLPTALELGRRLGLGMPQEIVIFGIQAEDARTFGVTLTKAAERGMKEAVDLVLRELELLHDWES